MARRGFLDLLDADGHEAQHVLVQAELALHLGDEGRLGVEAEQHVVALAVLLDPVGQAAQAPVFALLDRAAVGFELGGDVVGDALDLLLRDVVACDEHGFVERHGVLPLACSAPAGMATPRDGTRGHSRGECRRPRQGRRGVKHGSGVGATEERDCCTHLADDGGAACHIPTRLPGPFVKTPRQAATLTKE